MGGEAECFDEAMSCEKKNKWLKAMQVEMKSFFELVKLLKCKRSTQE
jgi:hypothetical protein